MGEEGRPSVSQGSRGLGRRTRGVLVEERAGRTWDPEGRRSQEEIQRVAGGFFPTTPTREWGRIGRGRLRLSDGRSREGAGDGRLDSERSPGGRWWETGQPATGLRTSTGLERRRSHLRGSRVRSVGNHDLCVGDDGVDGGQQIKRKRDFSRCNVTR